MDFLERIEPYLINLIPVVIGIAMVVAWRRRNRARDCWRQFAQKHGFGYTPPGPVKLSSIMAAVALQNPGEVSGEVYGLPLRLHVAVRGGSKNRRVFTVMSAEIPRIPAGLKIYHQNRFLQLTKLFGAQDVETGDRAFDAAFVVKGKDPAAVAAWLDESRRAALLRVLGQNQDMDIEEGCLSFEREQIIDSEEVLEKALEGFSALIPYLKSEG